MRGTAQTNLWREHGKGSLSNVSNVKRRVIYQRTVLMLTRKTMTITRLLGTEEVSAGVAQLVGVAKEGG